MLIGAQIRLTRLSFVGVFPVILFHVHIHLFDLELWTKQKPWIFVTHDTFGEEELLIRAR